MPFTKSWPYPVLPQKLLDSMSHPLDYGLAALGVGAGAIVSVTSGGADLGGSMAVGGTFGVVVSKGARGAVRRPGLIKRARRLREILVEYEEAELVRRLDKERALFKQKALRADGFGAQLAAIVEAFRLSEKVLPPDEDDR